MASQWWGRILAALQGATSRVTRLINVIDSTDYVEGSLNDEIGFWFASVKRFRISFTGVAAILDSPTGNFIVQRGGSQMFSIDGTNTQFVTTATPNVDGQANGLGIRAVRWSELRQSRPFESILPWGKSAAAQLPQKNFAAGTNAVTIAANALGVPVFRAVTPAVAGQTSILADQAALLHRLRTPSMEVFVDMDAAAIAGGVVRIGMTSDLAYGGATEAAIADWNAATGFWRLQTYTGGALTSSTDTTVSHTAGTFQRIEVVVATDGSVTLYINGTSVKTAAAAAVGAAVMFRQERAETGAGGAAITVDIAQEDTRCSAVV